VDQNLALIALILPAAILVKLMKNITEIIAPGENALQIYIVAIKND
jgi:hypothetical protein